MKNKEDHECEYYLGKIKDVTIISNQIHCRRCGGKLVDSHVDPKILQMIKLRFERRTGK